jgi:hypothetical protein
MALDVNRHYRERAIQRARRKQLAKGASEQYVRMLATTPTPCSCWMCRNPRRMEGPPIQERRHCQPINPQE